MSTLQPWKTVLPTHREPIPQIWYHHDLFPHPTMINVVQSMAEMNEPDFSFVCFFFCQYFKKIFILNLDRARAIILDINFLSKIVAF